MRLSVSAVVAMLLLAAGIAAEEAVDREMVAKIRAEGFERSKAMEVFTHLTSVIGPRLTASPAYKQAVEWTRAKLQEWGLANVHTEPWEFGRGWTLERFSIEMLEPRYFPLMGFPRAWSPSTQGRVVAGPIWLRGGAAGDLQRYAGKLGGAIVMTRPIQTDFSRADRPDPPRALQPSTPPRNDVPPVPADQGRRQAGQAMQREVQALLERERPAVAIEPNIGEHGTIFVTGVGRTASDNPAPAIVLASEHYNMVARLLAQGITVMLAVDLQTRFHDEDTNAYHVIAELPGVDPRLRHEVVMVGAHLDSWHAATGATDNADGVSVAMEALRILRVIGARPRRTIRLALWGGEEQGLLGSRAWVRRHLEGAANQTARDNFSVYFNLDNGVAPIYGFYLHGNTAMLPIMDAYLRPFEGLGVKYNTLQGIGQTDHLSFLELGLPGYQAVHSYTDYDVRTHHTNMDTFERVAEDDLKQAAVVMASVLYHSAMRDEKMPRNAEWGSR